VNDENQVWIRDNNYLQLRICIVRHSGAAGHRGVALHSPLSKVSVGGLIWKKRSGILFPMLTLSRQ